MLPNFLLARHSRWIFGALAAAVLALIAIAAINFDHLMKAQQQSIHSYQVLRGTALARESLLWSDRGLPACVLGASSLFVEPSKEWERFYDHVKSMHAAARENPAQIDRIDRLHALGKDFSRDYLTRMQVLCDQTLAGGRPAIATASAMNLLRRQYQGAMIVLLDEIAQAEQDMLTEWTRRVQLLQGATGWGLVAGVLLTLIAAVLFVVTLMRNAHSLSQTNKALEGSEASIRAILDNVVDGIVVIDDHGAIEIFSQGAQRIFGYSGVEVLGRNVNVLMPEPYRSAHDQHLRRYMDTGQNSVLGITNRELVGCRRDGTEFPLELGVNEVKLPERRIFIGMVRDITEQKGAQQELRIAATAFESQEGMVVTDAKSVILRVNHAFSEFTGYSAEEAMGKTPALLKSGTHDDLFYRQMWESLTKARYWQGEIWNKRKNGNVYLAWLTISAVSGPDGTVTHYVGAFSDITQRKVAEEEIHRLVFYDPLTGLPNRRLLLDRLRQAIPASVRRCSFGALLFLDLDNFKTLNDTKGHEFGDLLLVEVARRLLACVRGDDTVARLGGDEFIVVLEELGRNAQEAATLAESVGEKIRATLSQPYSLHSQDYMSTPSIGISLFLGDEETVDELLKRADVAMYQAKSAGRNTIRFFDPAMQAALDARAALEAGLRGALPNKQLVLHYQAQTNGANRILGAEVLLRWAHPERGLVAPSDFIPLAEESGLIVPIGQWVLETACAQIRVWEDEATKGDLQLAVNVSSRQFRQVDFVDQVRATLERTKANPKRLKLELTESLVLDDVSDTIAKMRALKALGIGFSMDDFGTGYSSLSYLQRLPLDQLKIDQSFVRDLSVDSSNAAIVRTIIILGQTLGLDVIAEGVETDAQWDFLSQNGCTAFQGYLFSRPLPLADFERLLLASSPPSVPLPG
jgi:diguanylate cyclase (GGDEF)-like protein/PAS domain S-box-containing protein